MKRQRTRVPTTIKSPSLTKQAFKKECDVNSILERYRKTGSITHVRNSPGQYGDFTQHTDYHTSVQTVIAAQDAFMALPAVIRKKFGNSPNQFIEFVSDEKNYDEAKKLGLLSPEAVAKRENDKTKTRNGNSTKGDSKQPVSGSAGDMRSPPAGTLAASERSES